VKGGEGMRREAKGGEEERRKEVKGGKGGGEGR
jgi:hypothetical protein